MKKTRLPVPWWALAARKEGMPGTRHQGSLNISNFAIEPGLAEILRVCLQNQSIIFASGKIMNRLTQLKEHLKRGQVYRRDDLAKWSKSIDRHLGLLVEDDTSQKLSQGLYYYPKIGLFGKTPPEEDVLIRTFLKDDRFLIMSPSSYNSLGVGTTQLYNKRTVYNHKRHGEFILGNRKFSFRMKPHFPGKVTREFLLVDLVNNLETLAEDPAEVLKNVASKVRSMDNRKLIRLLNQYGSSKAKKILAPLLNSASVR